MDSHLNDLTLRTITSDDCQTISEAFAAQGWNKAVSQYQRYVSEQAKGVRDTIIAEWQGSFAGYLTISWQSTYLPFKTKNIPEIVDFNVLIKYQRQGIGTVLMDEAERRIKRTSLVAGIGVGVTMDYGPAHILYIKRGYVPDGRGWVHDSIPVIYGEEVSISDDIVLMLVKEL